MGVLKDKTIIGMKWSTVGAIMAATSGLLLKVVQARYLTPSDFAEIAVIMMALTFTQIIDNFGLTQALIQKDDLKKEETDIIFTFNLSLSVIMGLIVIFLLNYITSFFSTPNVDGFKWYIALIIVISGPFHIFKGFLQKTMLFKEITIIETIRNLSIVIFTFIFLVLGNGVLAVILGYLISESISTIIIVCYSIINKILIPNLNFNIIKIRGTLKFGAYVLGKQIVNFFSTNVDKILIGYFLPSEVLGIYHFGKSIVEQVKRIIDYPAQRVLLPVYAKKSNDAKSIKAIYVKTIPLLSFFIMPTLIGIALTAEFYFPLLFGEKWIESAVVLKYLAIGYIPLLTFGNASTAVIYAFGVPDRLFKVEFICDFLLLTLLYIFSRQGMIFVLVIYISYLIIKALLTMNCTNKIINYGLMNSIIDLKRIIIPTFLMTLFLVVFDMLFNLNNILMLIISITIGVFSYTVMMLIFNSALVKEIKSYVLHRGVYRS